MLLGRNFPDWIAYITCGASLIVALAVCVLSYPLLTRLAEQGQVELILERKRLHWRKVDFSGPYKAKIASVAGDLGGRNASVTLYLGAEIVPLAGIPQGEVLCLFPEPYFGEKLAHRPKEGSGTLIFLPTPPAARAFFAPLLESLWRNCQHNSRFQLYTRYLWQDL